MSDRIMGDDGANTIPWRPRQPHPEHCLVTYYRLGLKVVSSIARLWAPGDSGPNGRCRLCRRCNASEGICLVTIESHIPLADAPLYSTVGHVVRDVGLRG